MTRRAEIECVLDAKAKVAGQSHAGGLFAVQVGVKGCRTRAYETARHELAGAVSRYDACDRAGADYRRASRRAHPSVR